MFIQISIVKKCALVLIFLFITETNQQNVIKKTIDFEDGNGRITKISILKNGNDVVVTSVSSSKSEIPSIPKVLPLATPTNSTISIKNSSSPANNTNKNNSSINTSNAVQINSSRAILPNKTNDNVPSKIPTDSSNAVNRKQANITSNSSSQSISIKKNTSNSSISISVSVNSNGSPVLPMKPIAPTPVESVNYPRGISLTASSNNKSIPLLITIQNNTVKIVGNNATSKNGVVSASSNASSGKTQNGASNQVSLSVSINKPGSVSASASSKADSSPKKNIPTVLKDVWYEDDWDMDDE